MKIPTAFFSTAPLIRPRQRTQSDVDAYAITGGSGVAKNYGTYNDAGSGDNQSPTDGNLKQC